MSIRRAAAVILSTVLAGTMAATPAEAGRSEAGLHSLRGPVTDENFYFVMADRFANGDTGNDRGGLPGDPLVSGFDPTRKGFYNGGDLTGLLQRIDYIRELGTTSIWLTPSFTNKAVQLEDGPSAGYHGYWITDFTRIDPHLGTNEELRALVESAHRKGMKVYFDIITNHTADVIGYEEGARMPYVSKDAEPYRTADGKPFDDRDYPNPFPTLNFPYTPVLDESEKNLKTPAWLNDVNLYHNRGDTTFTGENSYYGDFFGLDDLFTENPRVVRGMIDIYKTWIADFGIDGFRIDTMKHVDDAFWQKFGPEVLSYARSQGKREFFMFGEVFDTSRSFTSQYTTRNRMQAVLDFPFQAAARDFASKGTSAADLGEFFAGDDWYTDADSNVYELPTFLGNHDMGRIGNFVVTDNPGASDAEWLARDRLAHELMYFSRGNPVVYYGDEQGFTGPGGDQDARQTMFASHVPEYLDDDLLGTGSTHAQDNFVPGHPLYQAISGLAAVTRQHPALRDGAHQNRYAEGNVYAFSRIDRRQQQEYVVALNNGETATTATIPTYARANNIERVYGNGKAKANGKNITVTIPPLSAVVYKTGKIPYSRKAPSAALTVGAESPSRIQVAANVAGDSFYEVTFYQKTGNNGWVPIGTDDTAPYRVFHDVSALKSGTPVHYKAVVLDNGNHTAISTPGTTRVPAPKLTIEAPAENSNVRDRVEIRATADPERGTHVVSFDRSVAGGPWTPIGTDSSSPAYTAFDDLSALNLTAGTTVRYRARLNTAEAIRTVRYAGPPLTTATLHYQRPAADYDGWGLHLWGESVDPALLATIGWDRPMPPTRIAGGWAEYDIALADDTKPVNFIMHLPNGDTVPTSREPGGDRSFLPIDNADVWIKQGDPTVYTSPPPGG
ncbi:glycosidase [Actinoplanes lutulentus]|uniref:Alpha-amylase n=1 Tax=Actinoplanes lutulentus TaxID=1287878 RepID=A0A327Z3N1_9ACTN|nr:alpha-amylase family glycosyl hydrolase [Actinoplanes lutulentus]MBB2947669.1 glycosidase [Actinoplanes lutulentus]RAK27725.1 glycosidase [Actinoplanes lutulentus]